MHDRKQIHCPPFSPTSTPTMAGGTIVLQAVSHGAPGNMILQQINCWLGSDTKQEIHGRWAPGGEDLGNLGSTMTIAFAAASEGDDEPPMVPLSSAEEAISDDFHWLDCVHYENTFKSLSRMLPWSCRAIHRHPLVGPAATSTLRSNIGALWKVGGEIHVTFNDDGRPFCAELTSAFWTKDEVAEGLKWLNVQLSRHASRTDVPAFETVTDGDEVRFGEVWWTDVFAHYEVFCTFGEEDEVDGVPEAAPHYITVRKFLLPTAVADA